jgi:hypothetical protein
MKSIKDFEEKGGCEGVHTLSYGSLGEHQAEMRLEEEVENLEDENSEQSEQSLNNFNKGLERKEQPIKEIPQENKVSQKYLEVKKRG